MKKNVVSAALFLAVLLIVVSALAQAPPQAPGGGTPPPMPRPTNLQVLPQDIPTPELMRIMRSFASSLGVQCGLCHVFNPAAHQVNFASDEKPTKKTARVMMRMTNDINTKYLAELTHGDHPMPAGEAHHEAPAVTCATCHRGHQMPEAFVPQQSEHGGPPSGAPPAGAHPDSGAPPVPPPPQ